jgi:ribosomal protein L11 methyltransferase
MAGTWRISFTTPYRTAEAFGAALDGLADAVTTIEHEPGGDELTPAEIWRVEAYAAKKPEAAAVTAALAAAAAFLDAEVPSPSIELLPETDWLAHVYEQLQPIEAGRFTVYGSHAEKPKAGRIGLLVDAATAFGSGEHETTRGCLTALSILARRLHRLARALDMGCGSGVLAIGMAKLWPQARVLGVDIEPESVAVSARNARRNRVAARVEAAVSTGYRNPRIRRGRPYGIVTANILARPLVRMAPSLKHHLASGGHAVLSGLLTRQARLVLAAHRTQGLVLVRRLALGEWTTLIVKRRPRRTAESR